MTSITETTEKILEYGPICDHCLGRMFGKSSHGLSNDERGKALRVALALEKNVPYEKRRRPAGSAETPSKKRGNGLKKQRNSSHPTSTNPSSSAAKSRPS